MTMIDIFTRVSMTLTLPQLMERLRSVYNIGTILDSAPILTGYQDCNIDVKTADGRYAVKIFSADKTRARIDDVMWGYSALAKAGVPLPQLVSAGNGSFLMEIPGPKQPSYCCVFRYFDGKNLTQTPITDDDVTRIVSAAGTIHETQKHIGRYYDTLGIVNVGAEFKLKQDALFADELSVIAPVIAAFNRVKLSSFRQSIIHGSLEKENILKSADGSLCLLDLGCMDENATLLDIATMIANFTVYLDDVKRKHMTAHILAEFGKITPIPKEELTALPALIRAQFAAYIIGMTYHMRKEHDMTKQNQTWLDRGWGGLRTYLKVRSIL